MSKLNELPEDVQKELRKLSREEIKNIADFVHIENCDLEQAAFPSDPAEGVRDVNKSIHRDITITIDDAPSYVLNILVMLRGMCLSAMDSSGSLDKVDIIAMTQQIDDAWSVLKSHDRNLTEASTRLRQMTHPVHPDKVA
ncbi:MAG: hypothetical protein R8G60_04930 [Roseovarius pacificus]|nr:hypothetical protein [Roseovarius pacificus]